MDRNEGYDLSDLPLDHQKSKEKGEEAQTTLDEIPPPGTDPLNEGP